MGAGCGSVGDLPHAEPQVTTSHPTPAVVVDASGLSCPLPVIELARTVADRADGEVVRLIATDPAAQVDVPVWCRLQGHRLLRRDEEPAGTWRFDVRCRSTGTPPTTGAPPTTAG